MKTHWETILNSILIGLAIVPLALQALAMFFDEFYFHRRRGLPQWERIGHPLDTLGVLAALSLPVFFNFSTLALVAYIVLAFLSSLMVTKDEFVHNKECEAAEQWLHSVLFVLHPMVFLSIAFFWNLKSDYPVLNQFIMGQFVLTICFMLYQIVYWNFIYSENQKINLDVYNELGENWYTATDDPVALLRAESRLTAPWIVSQISNKTTTSTTKILDLGCGAGFLSNELAKEGFKVTGFDLSQESLTVAKNHDSTKTVQYIQGNANLLPFEDASFDVICCMDFLEHVEDINPILKEVSRVLKPGGKFFFHTFNRNPLSRFVVIHLVELILKKTPKNLHIYKLFIKPKELNQACESQGLKVDTMLGLRPKIFSRGFWMSLISFRVLDDFKFEFTQSLAISYLGKAQKGFQ
jgi:2-polyprenyl-6-hydroxyphenyl methylase / 3-demethylubiquinone-9 3-methyltransferase